MASVFHKWLIFFYEVCGDSYSSIHSTSTMIFVMWCISKVLRTRFAFHDGVIQWKHFPRYWPFVRGIYRSPLNSPHKVQQHGALMFSLIFAMNKQLSKQSWCWWFAMPPHPLWRHWNVGSVWCSLVPVDFILLTNNLGPRLLIRINFNPSMDK